MKKSPQDTQAEAAALGCIMIDNTVLDDATIRPDDFYRETHGDVFRVMQKMYADGKEIDLVTLADTCRAGGFLGAVGGASGLASLMDIPATAAQFPAYERIIKEKSILRSIQRVAVQTLAELEDTDEPSELLANLEDRVREISEGERDPGFKIFAEGLVSHVNSVEKASSERRTVGIPTGFKGLDRVLSGLFPGEMIVLAARPGQGKTTLAMNIAANFAKAGNPVAVLSLEMRTDVLMTRMICSEAQLNSSLVRAGKLERDELQQYAEHAKRISDLPIYINDNGRTTLNMFKAQIRRLVRRKGVKLVAVDYLQLMRIGDGAKRTRYEETTEISRELKLLADNLKISILALGQLNRASEAGKGGKPGMSQLRDSGAIEQDADVVLMIHGKAQEVSCEVMIEKNRNGGTGTIELEFERTYNRFQDTE